MFDDSSYDEIDLDAFEIDSNGSPIAKKEVFKTETSYNYQSKESVESEAIPLNNMDSQVSLTRPRRSSQAKNRAENNG